MAKSRVDTITDTDVLEAPQMSENPPVESSLKTVERDSRIFLLSNDKRQGTVIIDLEEEVIDPSTGKTRAMRLLRRAPSIWLDEQSAAQFPAAYVAKNVLTVTFTKGKCIIPMHEKLKLQAMDLSNRNTGNKKRIGAKDIYFYEWNPLVENAKAIKEEDMVIKAMQLAMTTPLEEMIPHAAYLNIQFVDEQGVEFDENALRAAYIRKAKNEADKFLKSVHSPVVKMTFLVKKAIANGRIDLSQQPGTAYWQDGGFISVIPEGKEADEYLVQFGMTHGDANIAFANQLRELTS